MKKSELKELIKEEIKKVLNNTPNTSTNESLLKIRDASFPNKNPGVVDTRLIDKLLSQIGPYLGYSDWKEKIQNPDYKGIIQKIAKHITNTGVLQSDRLEIE
jgi:hypothetical protein